MVTGVVDAVQVVTMDQEKRKRKIGQAKKASAFKPQPVQLPKSSDTPPEEDEATTTRIHLPPPPSERKAARRRESTRAIKERPASPSLSPPPPTMFKRQKTNPPSSSVTNTLQYLPPTLPTSTSSISQVEGLTFASVSTSRSRHRQSMARLPSPERTIQGGSSTGWGSKSVMGPPALDGFVRKTRKSMGCLQLPLSTDEMVLLPESETPMIRKNKELREAQSRRSSLGMRGQRASSSLGRGDLSVPHHTVDSKLFYSHISSATPEPIRARHLLTFCFDRASKAELDPESKGKARGITRKPEGERTDEGDQLLGDIVADFVRNLGQGGIDTNVFSSGPNTSSGVPLRPHPKNAENRSLKQSEDKIIRRCKEECNEWARLQVEARTQKKNTIDHIAKRARLNKDPDMSSAEGWMVDALEVAEGIIEGGDGDLTDMGEFHDVEFKVDVLHQSTHAALNFAHQSSQFLNGIFSNLINDMESRGTLASTSASAVDVNTKGKTAAGQKKDPMHMLRALAAAESSRVSDETLAAAAAVAPAVSGGATPRRRGVLGGATPRRAVGGARASVAAEAE